MLARKGTKMRVKITHHGFPTITFSKLDKPLYSELGAAIATSPKLERRMLTASELLGKPATQKAKNKLNGFWMAAKADWNQTQTRKRIGEDKAYVLYYPLEDGQKLTIRSCFPGTIMEWNMANGTLYAIGDSFLVAELTVKAEVYRTDDVDIKRFSGTNDAFQKFSGTGCVYLEVHGDLEKIPLYPGESVRVCPGYFLAMTEGVTMRMVSAGDVMIRKREKQDYWIEFTAPTKDPVTGEEFHDPEQTVATVYLHSVVDKEFWKQHPVEEKDKKEDEDEDEKE